MALALPLSVELVVPSELRWSTMSTLPESSLPKSSTYIVRKGTRKTECLLMVTLGGRPFITLVGARTQRVFEHCTIA